MTQRELSLSLTRDEALVLFEILSRYAESSDEDAVAIADPAERQAIWNLLACLEKELHEPFLPIYSDFLATAKSKLC